MKIVETINEMRKVRPGLAEPVGLVPTMGYLHEGHLSLVKAAKADNPSVVASIFVNPTQFGPSEDFKGYPRDIKRDLELLEKEKTDIVFIPQATEIYPPRFDTWISVGNLAKRLEGASRRGHFRGVTTVVGKLFNIVEANNAYFGQKDAQQAMVIKKMAADLDMNINVVVLPTVRESDGLAMSSRNSYLNPQERKSALVLYQSLKLAEKLWSEGTKDASHIREEMLALIKKEPLAKVDYVSVADSETFEELETVTPQALVSLAVKIGSTRLIDNIVLK